MIILICLFIVKIFKNTYFNQGLIKVKDLTLVLCKGLELVGD